MTIDRIEIFKEFEKKSIPFQRNVNLTVYSSFKIGGISPLFVEPENTEQIFDTLSILNRFEMPYKVLGGGTNVLISDHPDNFAILKLSGQFREYVNLSDNSFMIGAGALTTPTFRKISMMRFTGAEFLSTIPGSVGGAVIQNAGCYGGEFFNLIEQVELIQNNQIKILPKKEIHFGYRTTQFLQKKDSIILRVKLTLKEGKLDDIEASLKEKRQRRNSSQPENKKSAGSVFKNPEGNKCWELIDKAGLRGVSKGGALISPEHSNFITNEGNATATDVDYLIKLIQEKVFEKFGIMLEREIEYFGDIP